MNVEEAIIRGRGDTYRRTSVLYALNVLGVICCAIVTILLCWWAKFDLIQEPMTSPVVLEHIRKEKERSLKEPYYGHSVGGKTGEVDLFAM